MGRRRLGEVGWAAQPEVAILAGCIGVCSLDGNPALLICAVSMSMHALGSCRSEAFKNWAISYDRVLRESVIGG